MVDACGSTARISAASDIFLSYIGGIRWWFRGGDGVCVLPYTGQLQPMGHGLRKWLIAPAHNVIVAGCGP